MIRRRTGSPRQVDVVSRNPRRRLRSLACPYGRVRADQVEHNAGPRRPSPPGNPGRRGRPRWFRARWRPTSPRIRSSFRGIAGRRRPSRPGLFSPLGQVRRHLAAGDARGPEDDYVQVCDRRRLRGHRRHRPPGGRVPGRAAAETGARWARGGARRREARADPGRGRRHRAGDDRRRRRRPGLARGDGLARAGGAEPRRPLHAATGGR